MHGIGIDLRNSNDTGRQRLILTLARHIDSDLFLGLCETLIASLKNVADPAIALAVTLAHLKRWKAFLAGRNARLLSSEEVRGLFGELHILRTLYHKTLPQAAAVDAWCGPDDSHHDFILVTIAIETIHCCRDARLNCWINLNHFLNKLFCWRIASYFSSERSCH